MTNRYQLQQGDVLLEVTDNIPESATVIPLDEFGRAILARGEATGHLHTFVGRGVRHFMADARTSGMLPGQVQYVDAPFGGRLFHETGPNMPTGEHDALPRKRLEVPAGKYRYIGQMEASWCEEPRLVVD